MSTLSIPSESDVDTRFDALVRFVPAQRAPRTMSTSRRSSTSTTASPSSPPSLLS